MGESHEIRFFFFSYVASIHVILMHQSLKRPCEEERKKGVTSFLPKSIKKRLSVENNVVSTDPPS